MEFNKDWQEILDLLFEDEDRAMELLRKHKELLSRLIKEYLKEEARIVYHGSAY